MNFSINALLEEYVIRGDVYEEWCILTVKMLNVFL